MQRRTLGVPKRTKFARLLQDGGVGHDRLVFRRAEIVADLENQRGNVIEQALRRKDGARADWKQIQESLEPATRERAVFDAHPRRKEVAEIGDDHGRGRTSTARLVAARSDSCGTRNRQYTAVLRLTQAQEHQGLR